MKHRAMVVFFSAMLVAVLTRTSSMCTLFPAVGAAVTASIIYRSYNLPEAEVQKMIDATTAADTESQSPCED